MNVSVAESKLKEHLTRLLRRPCLKAFASALSFKAGDVASEVSTIEKVEEKSIGPGIEDWVAWGVSKALTHELNGQALDKQITGLVGDVVKTLRDRVDILIEQTVADHLQRIKASGKGI